MKTFKWNDSREKMPKTICGYSDLILIAYKVDDEFNPGEKCYEYAIAVYKHKQKNSEVVIMDVFGGTYYKMWQDVDYWSYIPTKADAKELKERIDNIARFLDVFSDECRYCPLRNKCLYDAEWHDLDCKDSIIKYLKGE